MLMLCTKALTTLSFFGRRSLPPIFLKRLYSNNMFAQSAEHYDYYEYEKEITHAFTDNICGYCKGSRFVRCNLCRSGCVSCSFSEVIPCPFCNNTGKTQAQTYEYKTTNIPWPKSVSTNATKRQYRVPF